MQPSSAEPDPAHRDSRGRPRSLAKKFQSSFQGLACAVRRESNFRIHFGVGAAVVLAGCLLRVSPVEWCLLVLSIAAVLAAEAFNTAVEMLARAITRDFHPDVKEALDTSSAAVLLVACGAAIVGVVIFLRRLGAVCGWW